MSNSGPQTSLSVSSGRLTEIQILRHPLTESETLGPGPGYPILSMLSRWFRCMIKVEVHKSKYCAMLTLGLWALSAVGTLGYITPKLEKHMMVDWSRDSPAFLKACLHVANTYLEVSSVYWPFHEYLLSTYCANPLLCIGDTASGQKSSWSLHSWGEIANKQV